MNQIETIPEIEVLIATALWLMDRGAIWFQLSVAKGQGINSQADTKRLREALLVAGLPENRIKTTSTGPDVIAFSKTSSMNLAMAETSRIAP